MICPWYRSLIRFSAAIPPQAISLFSFPSLYYRCFFPFDRSSPYFVFPLTGTESVGFTLTRIVWWITFFYSYTCGVPKFVDTISTLNRQLWNPFSSWVWRLWHVVYLLSFFPVNLFCSIIARILSPLNPLHRRLFFFFFCKRSKNEMWRNWKLFVLDTINRCHRAVTTYFGFYRLSFIFLHKRFTFTPRLRQWKSLQYFRVVTTPWFGID